MTYSTRIWLLCILSTFLLTGFTCSKQVPVNEKSDTPASEATPAPEAAPQEEMTAPETNQ